MHYRSTNLADSEIRGGIRGIVELEILRAIESHINVRRPGPGIPLQRFFDLIVGTR